MKRHGYRGWKRIICRIIGHDPWYAATRKNWYGLIVAYRMNCWRCGQEIETFHPEAFESVPYSAVAGNSKAC